MSRGKENRRSLWQAVVQAVVGAVNKLLAESGCRPSLLEPMEQRVMLSGTPVVPAAPTGLTLSNPGPGGQLVAWTETDTNISGFDIYREDGDGTDGGYTQIATIGARMPFYLDTTVQAGQQYTYMVTAFNAGGESVPSNAVLSGTEAAVTETAAPPLTQRTPVTQGTPVRESPPVTQYFPVTQGPSGTIPTTTTVAYSEDATGTQATLTAVVASAAGDNPTGVVQFQIDGANVGDPVTLAQGAATCTASITSSLSAGSQSITASYDGESNFAPSSAMEVTGTNTPTTLNGDLSSTMPSVTLEVDSGVSVQIDATQNLADLVLAPSSQVAFAISQGAGLGAAQLNTIDSLAIDGTSTLDLGNNALMINYGANPSPLTNVAAWVASGQNSDANWGGTGITSSFAANVASTDNNVYVGVGYNEASTIASVAGATTFLGANIDTSSTAVLVVPTLYGDCLLQGTVGLLDLSIFSASFNQSASLGWAQGDFYDQGTVGLPDYSLFLDNFGNSLTSYPAQGTTATAVTCGDLTPQLGQAVTFTATVTPTVGSGETGTVQFYDGNTALGSPATLSGGVATLTTSALVAGSHSIAATYSGDSNFVSSTSSVWTQTIEPIAMVSAPQVRGFSNEPAWQFASLAAMAGTPASVFAATVTVDGNTYDATVSGPTGGPYEVTLGSENDPFLLPPGKYDYTVNATCTPTDGSGQSNSSAANMAVVLDPSTSVQLSASAASPAYVQDIPATQAIATFTDPVVSGGAPLDISQYTAVVDWGDGTDGKPDVQTLQGTYSPGSPIVYSDGLFTITATHTYAYNADPAPISVTVSDGWTTLVPGNISTVMVPPNITDQPLNFFPVTSLASTTGQDITQTLATFTDPDPLANGAGVDASTNYAAVIDWGDSSGEDTVGRVSLDTSGTINTYTVTGSHAYAASGNNQVNVTIYDDTNSQSASTTDSGQSPIAMSVNDPLVAIDGSALNSVAEGTLYTLPLDDNTNGTPLTSLTVDWGDGKGPQNIPLTGGSVPATWPNTYEQPFPDTTITVAATAYIDSRNVTTTYTIPMDVLDEPVTNITPTFKKTSSSDGSWVYKLTGSFTDVGLDDSHTVTIDWNDGSGPKPETVTESDGQGRLTAVKHTYYEAGTYHPVLTFTGSGGTVTTQQFTLKVGSPVITLTGESSGLTATEGTPSSATLASFTDGSGSNTGYASYNGDVTVQWGNGAVHTATLSPGDGANIDITDPTAPDVSGSDVPVTIVYDDGGERESVVDTANISDPPADITSAVGSWVPDARTPFSDVLIATFPSPNGDTNGADFTLTLTDTADDVLAADATWDSINNRFDVTVGGSFDQASTSTTSEGLTLEVDDNLGVATNSAVIPITVNETAPAAPDYLSAAINSTSGGIDLSWDASDGATSYSLQRSRDGGQTWITVASGLTGLSCSNWSGESDDQYIVVASNSAGSSGASVPVSATSATAPQIALQSFSATVGTDLDGATIATFTDPGNDTNADDFTAYLSNANQDGFNATVTWDSSNSRFDVTVDGGFSADGTQSMTLQVNNTANGTTTAIDFQVPVAAQTPDTPQDLQAAAVSPTEIDLSWSASSGAAWYDIYRDGSTSPFVSDVTDTFYADGGLNVESSHDYCVVACNLASDGGTVLQSGPSNTATATTQDIAPVAIDYGVGTDGSYTYTVIQGQTLTIGNQSWTFPNGILSSASDSNRQPLTAVKLSGPTQGSLDLNQYGAFVYNAPMDFAGPVTFTYAASDGTEQSEAATVTIDVVAGVPTAGGRPFYVNPGQTYYGNLADLDGLQTPSPFGVYVGGSDPNGIPLTYSLAAQATDGTAVVQSDGDFSYAPTGDFVGQDSFTWTVSNGAIQSTTASAEIYVGPVAMAASDDGITATSGQTETSQVWSGDGAQGDTRLTGNDVVPGGAVVVVDSYPSNGDFTVNDDGSWSFTAGDVAAPTLSTATYHLTLDGIDSNEATVRILVNPADPPSGGGQWPGLGVPGRSNVRYGVNAPLEWSIHQGQPLSVGAQRGGGIPDGLLGMTTDGTELSNPDITTSAGGSIVAQDDGSFVYTPPAGFVGDDTFVYTVHNANGPNSTAQFAGVIQVTDQAPVATGTSTPYSVYQGQSITIPASAFGGYDPDTWPIYGGYDDTLTLDVQGAAHGTLTESDGNYTYTAPADWTGTDFITYTLSDGAYTSNVGTVNITVPSIHLRLLWNGTNNDPANDADGSGEQLYLEGDSTSPPSSGLEELQLSASPGFTSYPAGTVFTLTESGDGQADVWSSTNSGATKLLDADNPSTSWTPSCDSNGDWSDLPPNYVWVDATGAGSMQFVLTATLPSADGGGDGDGDAVLGEHSFADDATTNPSTNPASQPAKGDAVAVTTSIVRLDFSGTAGIDSVFSDSNREDVFAPVWRAGVDGKAPVANPVCFPAGALLQAGVRLHATGLAPGANYWVFGEETSKPRLLFLGLATVQPNGDLDGTVYSVDAMLPGTPFSTAVTVKYPLLHQVDDGNLTVNWSVDTGGATWDSAKWVGAGTTQDREYVVLRQGYVQAAQTVLDIACRDAKGAKTPAQALPGVWAPFNAAPGSMPSLTNCAGQPLVYWGQFAYDNQRDITGDANDPHTVAFLLKNRQGACQAFAQLLFGALWVQGIDARVYPVLPKVPGVDLVINNNIPGQNHQPGADTHLPNQFNAHAVVALATNAAALGLPTNVLYDPSYGQTFSVKGGDLAAARLQWETVCLAGMFTGQHVWISRDDWLTSRQKDPSMTTTL